MAKLTTDETKNIQVPFIGIKIPMFMHREASVITIIILVVYLSVPDVYKECESNEIYSSLVKFFFVHN